MKLTSWREANNYSMDKMAALIGVSGRMTIHRYEQGRLPEKPVMDKIIEITGGEVTANDWFEIPAIKTEGEAAA